VTSRSSDGSQGFASRRASGRSTILIAVAGTPARSVPAARSRSVDRNSGCVRGHRSHLSNWLLDGSTSLLSHLGLEVPRSRHAAPLSLVPSERPYQRHTEGEHRSASLSGLARAPGNSPEQGPGRRRPAAVRPATASQHGARLLVARELALPASLALGFPAPQPRHPPER
jgi:hypothetical protein